MTVQIPMEGLFGGWGVSPRSFVASKSILERLRPQGFDFKNRGGRSKRGPK